MAILVVGDYTPRDSALIMFCGIGLLLVAYGLSTHLREFRSEISMFLIVRLALVVTATAS